MDIYVSSYAPSFSALIRAGNRVRAQKEARDAAGATNVISFATVGHGRPSAAMDLSELPEVEHEIEGIRSKTTMPPEVQFQTVTGDAATIEGAVQAFPDHRWVHGAQHATWPFEPWFAMRWTADRHAYHPEMLHECRICVLVCVPYRGRGQVDAGRGATSSGRM